MDLQIKNLLMPISIRLSYLLANRIYLKSYKVILTDLLKYNSNYKFLVIYAMIKVYLSKKNSI